MVLEQNKTVHANEQQGSALTVQQQRMINLKQKICQTTANIREMKTDSKDIQIKSAKQRKDQDVLIYEFLNERFQTQEDRRNSIGENENCQVWHDWFHQAMMKHENHLITIAYLYKLQSPPSFTIFPMQKSIFNQCLPARSSKISKEGI